MKKVFSIFIIAALVFTGSIASVFAEHVHDWGSWETVRKATIDRNGLKEKVCYECGKTQRKSIPKKKLTSNQKKAVRVVTNYMKAARSYNVKKMNSCFKKTSRKYGYLTERIDWVFRKYNKKIKWKIIDAKGQGNTITIKADVTRPDFYYPAYQAFYETVEWAAFHQNKATESKIADLLFGKYNRKVRNSTKKTSTETVKFTIVKTGNQWKIKSQTREMVDIATAYYWIASEDANDDILDEYS